MATTEDEYPDALHPDLRAKFEQLADLLRRPGKELGDYHAACLLVRALVPLERTYRTGSVDKLAAALSGPETKPDKKADKEAVKKAAVVRSLLYRLLKFAKYYPAGLPAGAAGRLTWEAIKPVLAVRYKNLRGALLAEILARERAPSLREVQALAPRRNPSRRITGPTEQTKKA